MANPGCKAAFQRLLAAPMPPAADRDPDGPTAEEWAALQRDVVLLDGRAHQAMIAADSIVLASGTAALEAMLAKRPMVVAYRLSALTAFIVRAFGLLKITRYSLPNILSGEDLVPELMQEACTARAIAEALDAWDRDPNRTQRVLARFGELHEGLRGGGSEAAAIAVAELAPALPAPSAAPAPAALPGPPA